MDQRQLIVILFTCLLVNGAHAGHVLNARNPTIDSLVQELINIRRYVDALNAKVSDTSLFKRDKIKDLSSLAHWFVVSDEYKGRRYFLAKKADLFTANDAQFKCYLYGGYLAEIDNAEEFNFVRSFLIAKNPNFVQMLIAGSDDVIEDKWVFPNKNRPVTYFNWTNGQPDGGKGSNNLCFWKGEYYMSDCWLFDGTSYICEIPTINTQ